MAKKERVENPAVSAPLWAAVRQGNKEFAQILQPLPTSIRLIEEPGTISNPTQQMVTEESRGGTAFKDLIAHYDSRSGGRDSPERGIER